MWRSWKPMYHWWGCKVVDPLWRKSMVVLQKIKRRIAIRSSNYPSGYIPQRSESRNLIRYLYTYIHSSVIHNSQSVETIQVSINRWMNGQSVVQTKNKILFSLKKEGNSDSCYNVDTLQRCYIKWNVSHKRTNVVWYLYEGPEVVKFVKRESSMMVVRVWREGKWGVIV